jgi:hypothetical protein
LSSIISGASSPIRMDISLVMSKVFSLLNYRGKSGGCRKIQTFS